MVRFYKIYTTLFNWYPENPQWWITGFNPEYKGEKADAKNQVMIGSVQFPNDKMYEAFAKDIAINQPDLLEYVILDDTHYTIWFMWGDKK